MIALTDFHYDTRLIQGMRSVLDAGARLDVVAMSAGPIGADVPAEATVTVLEPPPGSTLKSRILRIASNLLHSLSFNLRLSKAARAARADVYWAVDAHTLWAAARASRHARAGLVFDAQELYAEQPGMRPWRRALYRVLERRLIGTVDVLVTVNDALADVFVEKYAERYKGPRPHVVASGPDRCAVNLADGSRPLRLLCLGSFQPDRGLHELVSAMKHVEGRATLTLQGYGVLEQGLRDLVDSLGLASTVVFAPPCAPSEVVERARTFDVGIVAVKPTCTNSLLATPVRLFSYLGAGLAIVLPDIPASARLARNSGFGLIVPSMDESVLAEAFDRLCSDPALVQDLKRRSAEACGAYLWSIQGAALVAALAVAAAAKGRGLGGPA